MNTTMLVPLFAAGATVIAAAILIAFLWCAWGAFKDWLDSRRKTR